MISVLPCSSSSCVLASLTSLFAATSVFVARTENCSTDDKSGDDLSTNSEDDVDSGATFEEDSEKDIDTAEIEEEDWFDYIRRSTAEAVDKMDQTKIRCWNKTHKKMKWKLALRIATSPSERWVKKAAEWNPETSSKYMTSRSIGRPKKEMGGRYQRLPQTDL